MNFCIQSLVERSRVVVQNNFDRTKVIEAALALSLAYQAPVPVERVNSANLFFTQQVKPTLVMQASRFNEHYVVNLDAVEELTQAFWMIRYHALHAGTIAPFAQAGFVDTLVKAPVFLTDDTHQFLNQHKAAIVALYNQMNNEEIVLLIQRAA